VDAHLVADPLDIETVDRLHRAGCLALGGAEGGEIVPANEELRGFMHGGGIETVLDVPGPVGIERQRRAARHDLARGGSAAVWRSAAAERVRRPLPLPTDGARYVEREHADAHHARVRRAASE
jgi:hypothetical protein